MYNKQSYFTHFWQHINTSGLSTDLSDEHHCVVGAIAVLAILNKLTMLLLQLNYFVCRFQGHSMRDELRCHTLVTSNARGTKGIKSVCFFVGLSSTRSLLFLHTEITSNTRIARTVMPLIVRDQVTRQCPQTTTFLKRRESQSGIKLRPFCLAA